MEASKNIMMESFLNFYLVLSLTLLLLSLLLLLHYYFVILLLLLLLILLHRCLIESSRSTNDLDT